ncbi:hypothetical protein PHET_01299 [Paragonimus heterotremus]|uniref:Uncharacterized protein n=1 Tax=Paragonimus heterotremus TaxID=100268 RepID=A0A8J4TI27_9TREM|nr:hypothetical protein PHET_01299 [Paragonimus heterotremus]
MSRSWRRKAAPEIPTNGIDNQQINRNNRSASQIKPDSTDPLKPNHVGTKLFGQLSEDIQENKINVNLAGPLPRDLHDNACYTVQSVCDHDYGASLKTPNLESASSESTEVCTNLFNVPFQMKKIPVSINLSVVCRRVIELFQRFDQHADYLGPSSAHETLQKLALYRYEMFWLPLAAAHKLYAGAPVDVHWVWLAHMLDPLAYRQDCQRMVGKLIEHKLVSNKKLKQMTDKARAMWQLHYPKEPFDFNTGRTGFGNLLETHDRNLWNWSKIASGDLLTIARCHQHFFYQVSLPHYMQADHLKEAEQRYKQFVHLKRIQHQYQQWHNHGKMDFAQFVTNQVREDDNSVQETSNSLAEPLLSCLPFDIELCWRAHLFHPRAYARDMSCLFGKLLHHPCQPYRSCMLSRLDDSLFAVQFSNGTKDRVCGFPRIDQLWTTCFPDQPLDKSGCLDRGISTRNRLERLSSVDIYRIATKYAQVSLNSVVAQLHPTPDKFSIKIQHIGQLHGDHDSTNGSRQVAKLNSPGCVWNAVDPGKPIARFTVISGVHDELTIQLIDKRGWFCPSNSLLGLATVSLQRAIENFRETAPVDYVLSSEFEEKSGNTFNMYLLCLYYTPPPIIDLMSTNSSEEDYRRSTQVSKIKLSFTITPPNRHAVRLRVQLGPAVVCKLPPPCPNSLGEQIWGICCCSPQNNQMNDAFGCQMKGQSRTDKCSYCENCRLKMPRTPPATNCAVDSGLADSRSLVLIHEIVNHLNEHVFTVRVLHNLVMGLSVVQVYADDRLLSVGCQIDQKQLPFLKVQPNKQPGSKSKLTLVTQNGTSDNGLSHIFAQRKSNLCQTLLSTIKKDVTEDVVCSNTDALPRNSFGMTYPTGLGLHPLREERAMIVKDADGDWCIVIGHWSGFQRLPAPEMAVSSTDCTPEKTYLNFSTTRGSGGHLSLRMHWLKVNERKVTCAQVSFVIILRDNVMTIFVGD